MISGYLLHRQGARSFEKRDDVHDVCNDKYKHVINYMLKILLYLVKCRNRKFLIFTIYTVYEASPTLTATFPL